ncbi:hypothetical protein HGRIS_010920 [Hohenbuehelia grisea]|uniref:Terpenoid synthase n=1 Tax=Hohenbuehelia grisea TaxID=104357 RepID=A0ABR3IYD7_9AGAR
MSVPMVSSPACAQVGIAINSKATEDTNFETTEIIPQMRQTIRRFIARLPQNGIRFDPPVITTLQPAATKEALRLGIDMTAVQRWMVWSCELIENFYPEHPLDLKVILVICSIVIFYIDDKMANEDHANMHLFPAHLVSGSPQADPILHVLATHLLPSMWTYFHPLAANCIAVSFIEFINGTVIEGMGISRDTVKAPAFPEYVRTKSGIPTPYAFWLFPKAKFPDMQTYIQAIPDLVGFINHTNDVFSVYKEELAGETDNYVHMRAQVAETGVLSALERICDETVEEMERITAQLKDSEEAYRTFFENVLGGYVRFHMSTTRYRMRELLETAD